MTFFNTGAGKDGYFLHFETDDKEKYLYMQEQARKCIDNVHTTDFAPVVHAHWIPQHQTALGLYPFECSRCGRWETVEFINDINNMPYCHCGAKMDEKENEK
jgi:hypothetical protein